MPGGFWFIKNSSTFPGNTFFVLNSHSLCKSRFEGGSLLAALQVAKDWFVHHLEVLDLQVALGHDRGDGPLAHPGEKFVRDQDEVSNDDIHPPPFTSSEIAGADRWKKGSGCVGRPSHAILYLRISRPSSRLAASTNILHFLRLFFPRVLLKLVAPRV